MSRALLLVAPLLATLGGCATPRIPLERLQPRSAEAIDPRLPIDAGIVAGPARPALTANIARLRGEAMAGEANFDRLANAARAAAAGSGAAQSERWIAAQQALSAAIAARAPVTRALGDLDALAGAALQQSGGLSEGDRLAIEQAAAGVAAIDARQAGRIAAIQASLAR